MADEKVLRIEFQDESPSRALVPVENRTNLPVPYSAEFLQSPLHTATEAIRERVERSQLNETLQNFVRLIGEGGDQPITPTPPPVSLTTPAAATGGGVPPTPPPPSATTATPPSPPPTPPAAPAAVFGLAALAEGLVIAGGVVVAFVAAVEGATVALHAAFNNLIDEFDRLDGTLAAARAQQEVTLIEERIASAPREAAEVIRAETDFQVETIKFQANVIRLISPLLSPLLDLSTNVFKIVNLLTEFAVQGVKAVENFWGVIRLIPGPIMQFAAVFEILKKIGDAIDKWRGQQAKNPFTKEAEEFLSGKIDPEVPRVNARPPRFRPLP